MSARRGTADTQVSQKKRKRIEECFGWLKTIALMRKVRHRGIEKGGLGVHVRGGGLQLGADAETDGQPSWCRMSPGRSVPARGRNGQNEPQIEALRRVRSHLGCVHFQFGIMRVTDSAKIAVFQQTASAMSARSRSPMSPDGLIESNSVRVPPPAL